MEDAAYLPGYGAALAASALAFWRSRSDVERRRTSLAAFAWTGSSAVRFEAAVGLHAVALLALDLALVALLISLAWKARHGWPVLAAVIQAIGAAALLAKLTDGRITGDLHLMVSSAATHLTALILLAGAWGQRGGLLSRVAAKAISVRVRSGARASA